MSAKLSAPQARKVAEAEAAYAAAKRELERAKAEREAVRERYAPRVPIGKLIAVGGFTIKRRVQSTGPRFSLTGFLEKHKLTAAMKPFVSRGSYEVWDVRPAPAKGKPSRSSSNGRRDPQSAREAVEAGST